MRHALRVIFFLHVLILPSTAQDNAPKDFAYYWRQAISAYEAKDYPAYFENMQAVVKFRPDNPSMKYNLAGAHALVGKPHEALELLGKLADMGLNFDAAADEDFNSIKDSEEFNAILKKFEQNRAPINHSEVAFKLSEKDLITEGVAYDPVAEMFYVGSIHQRKIVSRDKHGAVKDFATAQDGLWSVFGMKVDAKRRTLWVCSTVTPQMVGFQKEQEGLSSVFKFDLNSGKIIKRYDLPNQPQPHWLGDLVVNSRGDAFITDSQAPGAVYTISQQKDGLELFIPAGPFRSPQGIDFSDDEKYLFVADYSIGILKFDLAAKQHIKLSAPENLAWIGIDGMYFYKNSLIAIQNGINPHRVVRFFLSKNHERIERAEVIEANNPFFNEPTLGVLVRDIFYYVANSQWGSFNKDGTIFPPEKLQEPIIMRVKL
jgi:sugar lactone lactonase YvrE